MTPTLTEIHQRSVAFRAEIVRRAALVVQKEDHRYFIPNTPYGVPKLHPEPPKPSRNEEPAYWHCMWFYDLVFGQRRTPAEGPSVRRIQSVVAEAYGFSMVEFLADRRTMPLVLARQIAMHLAKRMTGRSLPEIGRRFGGRDHTTVIYAVNKIDRMLAGDTEFSDRVHALKLAILA